MYCIYFIIMIILFNNCLELVANSEEDNDDIIPILEAHSERLRDLYGDYYISELVARHPESERVLLVCEVRKREYSL